MHQRASEINHCCWHFNKQLLRRMLWNEHGHDHQIFLKEDTGGYKAACSVSQERRNSKIIVKQPPSGVSPWEWP